MGLHHHFIERRHIRATAAAVDWEAIAVLEKLEQKAQARREAKAKRQAVTIRHFSWEQGQ